MILDILNESKVFKSVSQIINKFYINYCGYEECKAQVISIDDLDIKVTVIYPSLKLSFLIPFPDDAKTISEFGVTLNPNFSYQVSKALHFHWLGVRDAKLAQTTAPRYFACLVLDNT